MSVVRLDAAAVEDAKLPRGIFADCLSGFTANEDVGFRSDLRGCCFAGSDRPDRLIRNAEFIYIRARDLAQRRSHLTPQDILRQPRFPLLEKFANTDDRFEPIGQRAAQLAIHPDIGFAKILAPLGVTDDHLLAANGDQHGRRNFSGKGTLLLKMHVLRPNFDPASAGRFDDRWNADKWGEKRDLVAIMSGDHRQKLAHKGARFIRCFVHLPVGGDQFVSHGIKSEQLIFPEVQMQDSLGNFPSEDSPRRSWAILILVVVAVALVGIGFDRLLIREGVSRYDLLAISNLLTGVVAGLFFWEARRRDSERRKFIRERLRTISEMNHHIRNALQVISLYSYKQRDEKTMKDLGHAVNRIEWALSEVLPAELLGHPPVSEERPWEAESHSAKQ